MVLLVQKLVSSLKHSSKMENHHPPDAFSASLQAFRSDISNSLTKISSNSEFGSLKWLQQCFKLLPIVHRAFAKLCVEIDYPMSKWEISSVEEYLNYSLNLLEFLNSINSAISHLNQARISISHASTLAANSRGKVKNLKEINSKDFSKDLKVKGTVESKQKKFTQKGLVLHEALMELKSIGLWVCSILLSGLCGDDVKPYMEMRKSGSSSIFSALDSSFCKEMMENRGIVKEIREVNESMGKTAEELQRKLEVLEKELKGIEEEANRMFSEVMAGRNELLDILRQQNQ